MHFNWHPWSASAPIIHGKNLRLYDQILVGEDIWLWCAPACTICVRVFGLRYRSSLKAKPYDNSTDRFVSVFGF